MNTLPTKPNAWVCDQGDGTFDHNWKECHDSAGGDRGTPILEWSWRECRVCGAIEGDNEIPTQRMSTPDKCPHCGSESIPSGSWQHRFSCGHTIDHDQREFGTNLCLERARANKLAAENSELKGTIRQLREEAKEWTTDDELVNKAHKLEEDCRTLCDLLYERTKERDAAKTELAKALERVKELEHDLKSSRAAWNSLNDQLQDAHLKLRNETHAKEKWRIVAGQMSNALHLAEPFNLGTGEPMKEALRKFDEAMKDGQ